MTSIYLPNVVTREDAFSEVLRWFNILLTLIFILFLTFPCCCLKGFRTLGPYTMSVSTWKVQPVLHSEADPDTSASFSHRLSSHLGARKHSCAWWTHRVTFATRSLLFMERGHPAVCFHRVFGTSEVVMEPQVKGFMCRRVTLLQQFEMQFYFCFCLPRVSSESKYPLRVWEKDLPWGGLHKVREEIITNIPFSLGKSFTFTNWTVEVSNLGADMSSCKSEIFVERKENCRLFSVCLIFLSLLKSQWDNT